ncbi:unnamed protein product [Urochloa decumbens]|uniref:DUF7595 domain-containing protein n=1 Tax=Urochloa decumbens TaxID=240449 RepID=A0ABC8ZVR0_9POAL
MMDQSPTLPADPLLEVIARSDNVTTVVRCAAVSKPLRRAILDPGFRRRLGLRAAATGGFDPDLVTSVAYRLRVRAGIGSRSNLVVANKPAGGSLRFDANLLRSFNPASSREALLVLRRDPDHERRGFVELLVCNAVTGHATPLPPMELLLAPSRAIRADVYRPALLSTGGCGSSLELLVMYRHRGMDPQQRETQIFSSQAAGWGAARRIHILPQDEQLAEATSTAPAVIGRRVHWLCNNSRGQPRVILAVHAEAAQATVIQLPQELVANLGGSYAMSCPAHNLMLAATAEGKRLSLVVAEKFVISVWTLLPDEGSSSSSWSREVVIRRREMGRELQLAAAVDAYQPIRFDVFGERSGTVLFWMQEIGLVQLNLGTKKAELLWKGGSPDSRDARAFLHEVDLVSLLQRMKAF